MMNRLTDERTREPSWTKMFVDNVVICNESRKQEARWPTERWRYALERRGMKVGRMIWLTWGKPSKATGSAEER